MTRAQAERALTVGAQDPTQEKFRTHKNRHVREKARLLQVRDVFWQHQQRTRAYSQPQEATTGT